MKRRQQHSQREAAREVVVRLRAAGHTALFAGGCVRDLIMDRTPNDYDVATDALPDRVVELFRRTEKVGAQFGVVIVRLWGHMIEVATFRSDGDYADGRHPTSVSFSDAEHDAQRRDFTVNGMFYDPLEDRIHDYVGGQEDLQRRVIRAIGDPAHRFGEDHLRMLRAVRFAARLGFELDEATAAAIRAAAERIRLISNERVRAEMELILTSPAKTRGWALMHDLGLTAWLIENTAWSAEEAAAASGRLDALPPCCGEALALAAILRKYSPTAAASRCRQLTCSNRVVQAVAWLLENLPRILACETFEPADFKLLLADPRCADLAALAAAEAAACELSTESLEVWATRTSSIPPADIAPPRLIGGDELLELGYRPGPAFSRVLSELYRRQLNGALQTREEALSLAAQLMQTDRD